MMMTTIETVPPASLPSTAVEECFPFVFARIAAGRFEDLASLDLTESTEQARWVLDLNAAAETTAAKLRDELHALVRGCDDMQLRRILLRIQRDLFNARRLDAKTIFALITTGTRLEHLADYDDAISRVAEARRRFEVTFTNELKGARQKLSALADADVLHRPLVLSSEVFLTQVRRYAKRTVDRPLSGKDRDIERTLMKYLSRMHAKTSPFSTFCHMAAGRMEERGDSFMANEGTVDAVTVVRLNGSIWTMLRPMLLAITAIADHLRLRINPTVTISDGLVKFLINVRNFESFQSLTALDGLEDIIALAADVPTRAVLVDRVFAANLVDGAREEVAHFIRQLIDYGLFEFDLGISAVDPDWDRAVVALLKPFALHCEPAKSVIDLLDALTAKAAAFGRGNADGRISILRNCSERLAAIRVALSVESEVYQPREARPPQAGGTMTVNAIDRGVRIPDKALLFEDSAIYDHLVFDRQRMAAVAGSMSHLMTRLAFTDALSLGRFQMTHYFRARYSADTRVPLIQFYEDYFRDCKVPEAEAKRTESPQQLDYPGASAYRQALAIRERATAAWSAALVARIQHRIIDCVNIEREDLDAVASEAPVVSQSRLPQATVAFLQPGRDANGDFFAVLNATGPGYGKTVNRFLHLFPPEVTDTQRTANLAAARGSRLVEIRDASTHNANLHPALLDREIASPGAQTSFRPEEQLAISDLVVFLGADGEMRLKHVPTGERVEVLDLGLEGMTSRSQMFRLLLFGFARGQHLAWYPAVAAGLAAWHLRFPTASPNGVQVQPRIVFDRRIVIRRRSWTISADSLPTRARDESDSAYFVRINGWRHQHGIPEYVFAFVTRERTWVGPKITKQTRDDYKPQFLSFRNFFSISLFETLLKRVAIELTIEEMLPLPSDMYERNDGHHAIEAVVQWTREES